MTVTDLTACIAVPTNKISKLAAAVATKESEIPPLMDRK